MKRKIIFKAKDGGPQSPVNAYFLCEFKSLFSIAILKFNKGGREQYHTHAFNAYTWFLKGSLIEEDISGETHTYKRSIFPKKTLKTKNHRVKALSNSYCLTLRGSWQDTWTEHNNDQTIETTFTHGRRILK